ncbi:MAG: MFS transporter, partial [Candidatus Neoclostridium sp.]
MQKTYKTTMWACYIGYVAQAVVNNFVPLLFVTFNKTFGIPIEKITLLVTVNFALQLCVDA